MDCHEKAKVTSRAPPLPPPPRDPAATVAADGMREAAWEGRRGPWEACGPEGAMHVALGGGGGHDSHMVRTRIASRQI